MQTANNLIITSAVHFPAFLFSVTHQHFYMVLFVLWILIQLAKELGKKLIFLYASGKQEEFKNKLRDIFLPLKIHFP